jgi:hypothetical protein
MDFGIKIAKMSVVIVFNRLLEKGIPPERGGRKATGLSFDESEYGSRVAGQR